MDLIFFVARDTGDCLTGTSPPPPHICVRVRWCTMPFGTSRDVCAVLTLPLPALRSSDSSLPRAPPILFGVSPAVLPRPGYWPAQVSRMEMLHVC